jgi:hypothetical protein
MIFKRLPCRSGGAAPHGDAVSEAMCSRICRLEATKGFLVKSPLIRWFHRRSTPYT